MNRSLFWPLITKLSKIYFSKTANKEYEYKRTIFYTLESMGGIYIKFLQAICITQKFMDGWGTPKEFEVFNRVQKEPIDISKYIPNQEDFLNIENEPFACGSFAQLYKGTLKNGEIVALKILRPSISKNLNNDLKKLNVLVRIINKFLPEGLLDYKAAFEEFSHNSLLETDYEREISNMEYFYNLYEDNSYIVVPKVYKNLSNKNVIVQQYIEGPTLADLISNVKANETLYSKCLELTGSNIWTQLMLVGGELLRTAMTEEYVFGDPHPGNIILLENNKIAYIDFGLIAMKPTSQKAFYLWVKSYFNLLNGSSDLGSMLQASFKCFCPDLAIALEKSSSFSENDLIGSVAKALNKKIKTTNDQVAKGLLEEGHMFKLFTEFLDSKNALMLKVDMRNFQLLKACQAFLCSMTTIDNNFGNKQFSEMMIGCMNYAFAYCEQKGVKNDIPHKSKYSVNEGYELLVDMLSSIANGDEFLFNNISERMFL